MVGGWPGGGLATLTCTEATDGPWNGPASTKLHVEEYQLVIIIASYRYHLSQESKLS